MVGHAARKMCTSTLEIGCELNLGPIQKIHGSRHFCRGRVQTRWWGRPATFFRMPTQGGGGVGGRVARKIRTSPLEIGCELNLDPIQECQGPPGVIPTCAMA